MFHKIKKVKPLPNYNLRVSFDDNKEKIYDVRPLILNKKEFSSLLLIDELFKHVEVDTGGYGVSWNEFIDLSCEELYYGGTDLN